MKQKLLEKIKQHTKGDPISAKRLARYIGEFIDEDTTQFPTRQLITELIEDGEPIGSNSNGYFYINNVTELNEYMENLQRRIDGIEERMDSVRYAYIGKNS